LWNDEHGKEAAVQALKNSLNRLGMDYVDLYLMHSPAGGKVLETWDAMIQLKEQGLTRSIGVANFNASHLKHLKEARPGHVPVVNQIEIHPFLAWGECVSYCEEEGIAVMAYSPLTKGRKLRDPSLCKIAGKYGKTAAQVMIRWSLQRGFICIPKSSSGERIAENANIFDFDISDQDMKILNGLDEHLITDWPGIMNTPWEP
jgi:diketogulonate reductase-like aldo/keto reductase